MHGQPHIRSLYTIPLKFTLVLPSIYVSIFSVLSSTKCWNLVFMTVNYPPFQKINTCTEQTNSQQMNRTDTLIWFCREMRETNHRIFLLASFYLSNLNTGNEISVVCPSLRRIFINNRITVRSRAVCCRSPTGLRMAVALSPCVGTRVCNLIWNCSDNFLCSSCGI